MLNCGEFYDFLIDSGVDFFCGVPDSLLKDFCAYVSDNCPEEKHTISANEGNAVALAAGYHLASGKIPLVYLQNSGQGNIINPLTSLTDPQVYGIPMILLIGWRGEPGVKDEPQHIKQGAVTEALCETLGLPFKHLPEQMDAAQNCVREVIDTAKEKNSPVALLVSKGTFESYKLQNKSVNDLSLIHI